MTQETIYHIGTPGTPWGVEEKAQWLAEQSKSVRILMMLSAKLRRLKQTST